MMLMQTYEIMINFSLSSRNIPNVPLYGYIGGGLNNIVEIND